MQPPVATSRSTLRHGSPTAQRLHSLNKTKAHTHTHTHTFPHTDLPAKVAASGVPRGVAPQLVVHLHPGEAVCAVPAGACCCYCLVCCCGCGWPSQCLQSVVEEGGSRDELRAAAAKCAQTQRKRKRYSTLGVLTPPHIRQRLTRVMRLHRIWPPRRLTWLRDATSKAKQAAPMI